MEFIFGIFPVMAIIIFLVVIGIFISVFVTGIITHRKNNKAPRLTVDATVAAKRYEISHSRDANGADSTYSRYYICFQFESGDRMEFMVRRDEYGLIVEGDKGKLTFQGTRYLGFERIY